MFSTNLKIIDLTHTIHSNIPMWDEGCHCILKTILDYDEDPESFSFRVQEFTCMLGSGTHMDLPSHINKQGFTADQFDISKSLYDIFVIDVSLNVNDFYKISKEDILHFEKNYTNITENSVVLFYTGWDKFWNNSSQYRNNLQFPSVSEEAALYLNEKSIAGIGIDTLSPDTVNSHFEVHKIMLGNNKFIIENVANLSLVPKMGAKITILPLKIKNATESPLRLIAFV